MIRKFSIARIVAIALGGLIIVLGLSFSLTAQNTPANSIAIKQGTEIWFDFIQGEETHNLFVTVVSVQPDIVVDWKTDGATPRIGHSTISKNEFETSRKLASDFKDGTNNADAGFVWMTKGLFDELSFGKTVYTKDDDSKRIGLVNDSKEHIDISIDEEMKSVEVIHAISVTTGNNDEYWILNDANNPMVIKAVISGRTIQVRQITL